MRPVLLLSILAASACSKWVPATFPTPEDPERRATNSYRITHRDGSTLVLRDAWVAGDTLEGRARQSGGNFQVRVALADVTAVEVPKANTFGTVMVVMSAVGLVAIAAGAAAGGAIWDDSPKGWGNLVAPRRHP